MKKVARESLRERRKSRVRARGSKKIPRLSVFKSNKRVYLQLVDDENRKTLGGVLSKEVGEKQGKTAAAFEAGKKLGALAGKNKIKSAVFDRGGYKFHGRIKAVFEGAQKGGLSFSKK